VEVQVVLVLLDKVVLRALAVVQAPQEVAEVVEQDLRLYQLLQVEEYLFQMEVVTLHQPNKH
jgi:hypothetical protein